MNNTAKKYEYIALKANSKSIPDLEDLIENIQNNGKYGYKLTHIFKHPYYDMIIAFMEYEYEEKEDE